MSWDTPCITKIPRRADGTTECEHLREEHDESDDDWPCKFCDCKSYREPVDDDE